MYIIYWKQRVTSERKVAFSIVEMAIVMVVIGLILAMAVKGQNLYQTAEMRKEVGKIRKFETAFAAYYAKTNSPFPVALTSSLGGGYAWDMQTLDAFLADGYINADDTVFKFAGNQPPSFVFELSAIENDGYSNEIKDVINVSSVGFSFKGTLRSYLCSVELMYDDKNVKGGNGRAVVPIYDSLSADYSDCFSLQGYYQEYLYLLLRF
jgi:hypothetical protein